MKAVLATAGGLILTAVVALAVVGGERRQQICVAIGLCRQPDLMGAMLLSVQRQQRLVVLSARLVVPVTSARDTTVGPLTVATTRQTAILPGTVSYSIDLSRLGDADLEWNEASRTLTVRRPPVRIEEPTILWNRAEVYGDRGWATALTDVADNLERDNREKAPGLFQAQARAPDLVTMADESADRALATLFAMPLAAAGFEDARVVIERS